MLKYEFTAFLAAWKAKVGDNMEKKQENILESSKKLV